MTREIIVTGAGKGLGRAIVTKLVGQGHRIIAVDKDKDLLSELERKSADQVRTWELDVTDGQGVARLFSSLDLAHLYGLVNNAGIYLGRSLLKYEEAEISRVLDVNLKGSIYFSQRFGAYLTSEKRHGAIVNISSSSIYGGSDAVYSASKAALVGLTKSCAMNFAPYVRVNAVAPGIVMTDLMAQIPETIIKWYRETELVKTPLVPEDVANTVAFLLSDEARNYTGTVFDLNNGFHL